MLAQDVPKSRRIELILRQIDALPTLPVVATRLLSLTASKESHARQVTELVASDPALTAKVLALCKSADKGLRDDVLTIDRAVVFLGFNTIRNAVLSIKVFEAFGDRADASQPTPGEGEGRFDYTAFWRHCLAVAITAELIAKRHPQRKDLNPDEAFVAGLLHDLGKLALDQVLPKAYARVIGLTELNQANIAEFERKIVGLDHHTAGKRLAEQWQLPHLLQDCIWLHGTPYDALPRLEHRPLIGLTTLADLVVRRQHVGYSGNYIFKHEPAQLAAAMGLRPDAIDDAAAHLREEFERRARALGLEDTPSRELFLASIQQANAMLGRLNGQLERRGQRAAVQNRVLESIASFHAATAPGRAVQDVLDQVAASATAALDRGFLAILYQGPTVAADATTPADPLTQDVGDDAWLISQYGPDAQAVHSQYLAAPPHTADLSEIQADPTGMSMSVTGILPWIADYLVDADDLRRVRMLPLSSGWGTVAILLHDRTNLPPWPVLAPLCATWGAAIAATAQHDGARRLGEELAEANCALAEAQDRLLLSESMARLGEMAAGAAHEMNNPLAVISGRSQLLASSLRAGTKEQKAAQTIFEQAHRLSDLITALRLFADPPKAKRKPTHLTALLDETVKRVRHEFDRGDGKHKPMDLQVKAPMPPVEVDAPMIAQALRELLRNALEAGPRRGVGVSTQIDEEGQRLLIQVTDDGVGMDGHVLNHAFDPFFSAKPAGRQMGMGLTRARQLALAHGGDIELRSSPDTGTIATLWLPLDPDHADGPDGDDPGEDEDRGVDLFDLAAAASGLRADSPGDPDLQVDLGPPVRAAKPSESRETSQTLRPPPRPALRR